MDARSFLPRWKHRFTLGRSSFFLVPVLLHFCAHPLIASAGTEGASFLDIPVGAGPAALGSAYTALAANAYAPTSNPAGLGFLKGTEIAGQHLSYVQSVRYEHCSAVVPLPQAPGSRIRRGLGFAVQDVGSGDMDRTNVANGLPVTGLGRFSSHWGAYSLSYGQTLTDPWSLGLTAKLIHASIDDVSASAYAFDAGSLYRWNDRLTLAAAVLNVGNGIKFLSQADELPLAGRVGAAYRPHRTWLVTSEAVYRRTGLGSFHVGGQWHPNEALFLRAGYKTDTLKGLNALAGFTTGLGIQVWGQELAYAWVPYGELGNAQYFSLVMRFGGPDASKRNLIRYSEPKGPRMARRMEPTPDAWTRLVEGEGSIR